jgi:hypothetical protein
MAVLLQNQQQIVLLTFTGTSNQNYELEVTAEAGTTVVKKFTVIVIRTVSAKYLEFYWTESKLYYCRMKATLVPDAPLKDFIYVWKL